MKMGVIGATVHGAQYPIIIGTNIFWWAGEGSLRVTPVQACTLQFPCCDQQIFLSNLITPNAISETLLSLSLSSAHMPHL